ncbi:MAG: response regulator [Arcobacteraceae bacterium]|nr:response regulator [Arcobacteraceae bacterium]
MKVLIIEDEPFIALDIQQHIESFGHEVVGYGCRYNDILSIFKYSQPNLIISDIHLGEELDGINIIEKLQAISSNFQVIYLTSYDFEDTIDRSLCTKPSGYVLKPFHPKELHIAIKIALHETTSLPINNTLDSLSNEYAYDFDTKELFYNKINLELSYLEREIFHLLYLHRNSLVLNETIDSYVWENRLISDSTRRGLIHRLRLKLNHNFIETIAGIGCKLNIDYTIL